MYCPRCAAQNPEYGRFCNACGTPLPLAFAPPPQFPYAEFGTRFVARLIDTVVLLPLMLGFIVPVIWLISQIPKGPNWEPAQKWEHPEATLIPFFGFLAIWWLITFAATWLYHAILESSERQGTIGKRTMGLIVTDLNGERISFGRASARWACSVFITGQTMLIGYVMVAFTEKKQTLHDMIAGTLVLKK